jgi:hypothetical protein
LEPIGNFKNIEQNIDNAAVTDALKSAFSSYFKKGYFITSEMMTQLSNKNIRGVLYLILAALSKSGYVIRNISDLSINTEGDSVERQKGMPDCIKIEFSPKDDKNIVKNVYYVRTELTNGNRNLSSITKFVEKFRFITFVKSASYVLHNKSASKLKEFIISCGGAIVQDDTGIPFKCLSEKKWNIIAFGTYIKPTLPVFNGYAQPDLAIFYKNNKKTDIPFYFGYGTSSNTARSHFIFAIQKFSNQDNKIHAEKEQQSTGEGCPCKKNKKQPEDSSDKKAIAWSKNDLMKNFDRETLNQIV